MSAFVFRRRPYVAVLLIAAIALLAIFGAGFSLAGSSGQKMYTNPNTGHVYVYVPGSWTRDQAWQVAAARGGYPVVFSSISEWRRVVQGLGFDSLQPAHTGHYQSPYGREPADGWLTYTGEPSAPLNQLFNSSGPDDGVRWHFSKDPEDGTYYYLKEGKNEDASVIWVDADHRLEDISVNYRGGVVIEYGS